MISVVRAAGEEKALKCERAHDRRFIANQAFLVTFSIATCTKILILAALASLLFLIKGRSQKNLHRILKCPLTPTTIHIQ